VSGNAFYFDQETRTQEAGEMRYTGRLSSAWNIGDHPNGGYMVTVVLNAIARVVSHPHPVSVTTHFLRPGAPEVPYEIDVHVIRIGRTVSHVRAAFSQQGKARIEVLAAFADLSSKVGIDAQITLPAPDLPPPEHCSARSAQAQNLELPITQRTDVRLHPDLAVPGLGRRAQIAGWIRFVDERPPDTHALVLFADAFPPSPLSLLGPIGWVPTLELTVNVIRRPAPGWVCAQFTTDELDHGRMIETGALWDSTGALVAQSRQLGLVMNQAEKK